MKKTLHFTDKELKSFKNLIKNDSTSLHCDLYNFEMFPVQEQRKKLRIQLLKQIQTLFPAHTLNEKHKISLLTPGIVPELSFMTVSLSHSHNIGGFVINSNTKNVIGFDLEYSERVKKETVAYISQEQELHEAPSPCALWTAKEASFKSLHKTQTYINKIFVSHWLQKTSDTYEYDFSIKDQNLTGKGCAIFFKTLVAGVSQIKN